jgi:hypothetical protein
MSGRSYADREMREIQKKFSHEIQSDAWDVKFELEDMLNDPEYHGRANESYSDKLANIPEADKLLIKQAQQYDNPIDWSYVADLEAKAISKEAKAYLKYKASSMYHREEGDSI